MSHHAGSERLEWGKFRHGGPFRSGPRSQGQTRLGLLKETTKIVGLFDGADGLQKTIQTNQPGQACQNLQMGGIITASHEEKKIRGQIVWCTKLGG